MCSLSLSSEQSQFHTKENFSDAQLEAGKSRGQGLNRIVFEQKEAFATS